MYVIKILNSKEHCWIANWQGDPPRTLKIKNAQRFKSPELANNRIKEVIKTHPLKKMNYKIQVFK